MVIRIDPRTGGTAQLAAARPRRALLVGGRRGLLQQHERVLLFDPGCLSSSRTIVVGLNPFALAADDRSIWVTGLGDDTLTQIQVR